MTEEGKPASREAGHPAEWRPLAAVLQSVLGQVAKQVQAPQKS